MGRLPLVALILAVCTGNICRSPMAEGFLRGMLAERGVEGVRVASCGVSGLEDSPAMPEGVQAMVENGVDISGHRARRMTAPMIREADLVLAMASEHRDAIAAQIDGAASRTFTLKEFARLLDQLPAARRRRARATSGCSRRRSRRPRGCARAAPSRRAGTRTSPTRWGWGWRRTGRPPGRSDSCATVWSRGSSAPGSPSRAGPRGAREESDEGLRCRLGSAAAHRSRRSRGPSPTSSVASGRCCG